MQQALSETGSEGTHSSNRSGDRHRQYTPPSSGEQSRTSSRHNRDGRHNYQQQKSNEIQVVSSSSFPVQSLQTVTESNGSNNKASAPTSSNGNAAPKKEKIKGLWGKVGKHGMAQAAAAKRSDEGDTNPSSQTARVPSNKWDQVLNPLVTKQDKRLAKKQSKGD